jgi:hypothetical protein
MEEKSEKTAEEMAQSRNSPFDVTSCKRMMTIAMKVEVAVLVFSCEVKTVA